MDVEAMNMILDGLLGTDASAAMPATYSVELWHGDPRLSASFEIDYLDYAPVEISGTAGWNAAADGTKTRTDVVLFPAPGGEADDTVTHWLMRDPDSGAAF